MCYIDDLSLKKSIKLLKKLKKKEESRLILVSEKKDQISILNAEVQALERGSLGFEGSQTARDIFKLEQRILNLAVNS